MSISQNFPSSRPSLNLNFARSKKLDPRITFTRTSTATFVDEDGLVKSVGDNVPRFEHTPSTGESLGLLIEESRTNLLLQSVTPDNLVSPWSKGPNTTRVGVTTAPDGTNTSVYYSGTGVGGNQYVLQTVNLSANTTYTTSVWAKLISGSVPTSGNIITLEYDNGTTNVRANVPFNGNLTTEWKRFSVTYTNVRAVTGYGQFFIADQNNTAQIAIWGAQTEVGSFSTSYIPTVASSATRSADVASITGANFSNWYNPSEGTMFVNTRILGYNSSGFPRPFGFVESSDQFNDYWHVVYNNSSGLIFTETRVNGGSPLGVTNFTLAANTNIKIANAVKNGEGQFTSFNGQSIVSNASSSLSSTINSILFNYGNHNGIIAQLIYYPVRLPNTQLQNLTK